MDLNLPLLLLAGASAAILAARSLLARPRAFDWLGVALAILGAAGLVSLFAFELAGLVGAGVWAVLVLGPLLVSRAQARAVLAQRYDFALFCARLLVVLHPTRAYRSAVPRMEALAAVARGDRASAERALDRYASFGPGHAAEARLERVRLGTDADEISTAVLALEDARAVAGPSLGFGVIRALAEIGERDVALARYRKNAAIFEGDAVEPLRTAAALVLSAAAGRVGDVDAILAGRLRDASAELKSLWRAAARHAAGDVGGTAELERLAGSRDGVVRRAARVRLGAAPADDHRSRRSPPVGEIDTALLDGVAARIADEDRFRFGSAAPQRPWATHVIAAVVGLVFVASEVLYVVERAAHGRSRQEVLYALGALWTPAVLDGGEWWRAVAPLFLHYGAAHAIFNVMGLYVLGPFVERALRWERYFVVYFVSGLVGTLLFIAREHFAPGPSSILVGASGSIMGLLGASVAILARGAWRERIPAARRRLALIGGIVVLQLVFDQLIEQISSFVHTVGAVTGLLVGALLTAGRRRRDG
mgnify:CR=1 FL=1